jgi:hypothetical protein
MTKHKKAYASFANLADTWADLLQPIHIAEGSQWYRTARTYAEELSQAYGVPIHYVSAIIAVLSPQAAWEVNKRDAQSLCRAWAEGLPLEDLSIGTYATQRAKAIGLLAELTAGTIRSAVELQDTISGKYGPKTLAFYWNILEPESDHYVTIDRWIIRAFQADNLHSGGGNSYVAVYKRIADVIRTKAIDLGYTPCAFQAMIWLCVKDLMGSRTYDLKD